MDKKRLVFLEASLPVLMQPKQDLLKSIESITYHLKSSYIHNAESWSKAKKFQTFPYPWLFNNEKGYTEAKDANLTWITLAYCMLLFEFWIRLYHRVCINM